MEQFKITDEMKKWCEENKEDIEGGDLYFMRSIGIDFCEEFNLEGSFDARGSPDGDMSLMYVADIHGLTVIIDGNVWFGTVEKFLNKIEYLENKIIEIKKHYQRF